MTIPTLLRPRPLAWALSAVLAAGLLSACNKPADTAPPADAGPAPSAPADTAPPSDTTPPADNTPPAEMPPPTDAPPATDIAPANPQPSDSATTEPDKGKTENPPKQ